MSKEVKSKIYQMVDSIDDETVLSQVMEDIAFYASKQDIINQLTPGQLKQLDEAIKDADDDNMISFDEFKREMDEWRKK